MATWEVYQFLTNAQYHCAVAWSLYQYYNCKFDAYTYIQFLKVFFVFWDVTKSYLWNEVGSLELENDLSNLKLNKVHLVTFSFQGFQVLNNKWNFSQACVVKFIVCKLSWTKFEWCYERLLVLQLLNHPPPPPKKKLSTITFHLLNQFLKYTHILFYEKNDIMIWIQYQVSPKPILFICIIVKLKEGLVLGYLC